MAHNVRHGFPFVQARSALRVLCGLKSLPTSEQFNVGYGFTAFSMLTPW